MENVKKQVKHLTYTTKSLEEKAKNIDRCNMEGAYDTDRPWEELILGLLELRKQVDDLLDLHGWKEIDMTKPHPSSEFCYLKTLDWVAELSKKTNEVVQEAGYLGGLVDDSFIETDIEDVGVTEKRLALKLTEVITFCTSWLNRIGYLEDERDEMQRYVNEKNRKRGCLEE